MGQNMSEEKLTKKENMAGENKSLLSLEESEESNGQNPEEDKELDGGLGRGFCLFFDNFCVGWNWLLVWDIHGSRIRRREFWSRLNWKYSGEN